ncbi:hypothetical protein D9615_003671 [Tricholomella constricta]|uniref:MULE transposase domain-containing protein n=1 Tax=Tricholomella constricta TaxID=117010 RepID=A0A8H5M730_9AGAR|nr:hypothetical protein D9615_003671 [Tricholomella constricta]
MDFRSFASPSPHLAYSTEFFDALSVSQICELSYPVVAPVGSVLAMNLSSNTPTSASATVIKPGEVIPSFRDLTSITAHMEADYNTNGMRSAWVKFRYLEEEYEMVYHFSKINLIRNVTNYEPAVQAFRHLISHLQSAQFRLGPAWDTFLKMSFTARIEGENWLEEDIFNALLELSYFRRAHRMQDLVPAEFNEQPRHLPVPDILLLPTSFLTDAIHAHNTDSPLYTPEIRALRHRVSTTEVRVIAMSSVTDNHFTAFVYRSGSPIIDYGDSLHHSPPLDVLTVIQWILAGVCQPPITDIKAGVIARQGPGNGNGSCGIAAHNFIEIAAETCIGLRAWNGSQAQTFRDAALEDLVRFHHIALQCNGNFLSWTTKISRDYDMSLPSTHVSSVSGYNDFNVYAPLTVHPVSCLQRSEITYLSKQIKPYMPKAHVPPVAQLKSMPINHTPPPLLPPFEPISTPRKVMLPPSPDTKQFIQFSPTRLSHKQRQQSSPEIITIDSSPIRDSSDVAMSDILDLLPPKGGNAEVKQPLFIDLCSPQILSQIKSIKSESLVIDLCSPPKFPTKLEVLDLCTPPSHKTKKRRLRVLSPSFDGAPEAKGRIVEAAPGVICLGSVFDSLEEAQAAIYAREEQLGHRWWMAQSKSDAQGNRKKMTFRCNHYAQHIPTHSTLIDPSDHRKGKSIRTGCRAHVNVNRVVHSSLWSVTTASWDHNHPREVPEGAPIRRRPTMEQKATVSQLSTSASQHFSRGQIAAVLQAQTGSSLEPRQISNMMGSARREARDEVASLGGDIHAILASLQQKSEEAHGWRFHLKLDEYSVATAIWWQSPLQVELAWRFSDILINDNTYNRNRTGYPLNVGITIDGHGASRNIWYAFHAVEDRAHFSWVFKCHVESAGVPPECLLSDRHKALIAAAEQTIPLTEHYFCIHHLGGNVEQNLRRTLSPDSWAHFKNTFWAVYRSVSPDEFERKWQELTAQFPPVKKYLDEELYPCRSQWAWAYTSYQFTCGVRTNGRVEGENRVNKAIGGPKKTLKQLFDGLNERTDGQTVQELTKVRDSSRRQHPTSIESIFPGPLNLLRKYAGPFALTTCFTQMEASMYYRTETMLRPEGVQDWLEYAVRVSPSVGYNWENGEELHMMNSFKNDSSHISTLFLLRLIRGRGLAVKHLFRVTHIGTQALHMVAVLVDDNYVLLSAMSRLKFNLGLVRPRWYQDKNLNLQSIPAAVAREAQTQRPDANLPASQQTSLVTANPLQTPKHHTPPVPPPTQTVPARTVYHEANAALRPLTSAVQTQEQLDELLDDLDELRAARRRATEEDQIHDPPISNPKGRPRTQRMTGAIEGPARGGGGARRGLRGQSSGRKCGHPALTITTVDYLGI